MGVAVAVAVAVGVAVAVAVGVAVVCVHMWECVVHCYVTRVTLFCFQTRLCLVLTFSVCIWHSSHVLFHFCSPLCATDGSQRSAV